MDAIPISSNREWVLLSNDKYGEPLGLWWKWMTTLRSLREENFLWVAVVVHDLGQTMRDGSDGCQVAYWVFFGRNLLMWWWQRLQHRQIGYKLGWNFSGSVTCWECEWLKAVWIERNLPCPPLILGPYFGPWCRPRSRQVGLEQIEE